MSRAQAAAALGFKDVEKAAVAVTAAHGKVGASSLQVRESLVLMREASVGNLTRMAGSATILAGSFGLMTGEVLLAVGAVVALVSPLAVLAVSAFKGEAEMRKFGASLLITGNYAGQTADSLKAMGVEIAASSHTTETSTRTVIESLVATGKIGSGALGSLADAAQNYAKITGENGTKFAKEYEAMGDHLVQFAVKHEDVYHDLTLAQVQAVNNLVKQGREEEAQAQLAADIDAASKKRLADSLVQQQALIDHYGFLMRALHGVGDAAKWMWDNILNIGRPDTPGDELKKAQQTLNSFNSPYNLQNNTPAVQAGRAAAAARLAAAQGVVSASDAKAASDAAEAKKNHDAIQKQFGDGKAHGRAPQDDNAVALDAAQKAQLAAQLPLTADVEQIAAIKHDEVAAELKLEKDRLAKQVHEKTITEATAALAGTAYKAAADAKDELINRQAAAALIQQELTQRKALGADLDTIASIQAYMAGTAEEANKIELDALAARQRLAHDELAAATNDLVIAGKITDVQQVELLVSQANVQVAQKAQAERQAQVRVIHETSLNAQAALEQQLSEREAQASLLTSTFARAVAERGILDTTQQIALTKAQEAVDAAKAGSAERTRAEQDLAGLKARQAADKTLLNRQTDLSHGIQDATDAARGLRDALARHDWGTVFDELQRTIDSIKASFNAHGLTGGVLAGGSAIATAIGGKTGNAIGAGLGVAGAGLTASAFLSGAGGVAAAGGIGAALGGGALGAGIANAILGSAAFLGPIGIIAGIGVALASLLKSKPSNNAAIASIAGTSGFAISGDKQTSETAQAATSAAGAVLQGEQLLQAAGIKLATTVTKIDIGTRDLTHVFLSTGEELRTAIGDPAAAAEAGLKAVLKGATYTSDAEKKLVESLVAAGKGFDDIATALQTYAAAQQVSAGIANQILQLQDPQAFDLKAVHDAIDAQRTAAQQAAAAGYLTADQLTTINGQLGTLEGLQIDAVMKRYGNALTAATDILKAAQSDVDAERQKAQAIYDAQVTAYQAVITKAQAAADSLGKFRDSLTSGPLAGLSATGQLSATRAQFNSLAALPAGDQTRLDGLQAASEAFLAADKAAAPSQLAYYRDLAAVRRATDASAKAAQAQVSDAQKQLDALNELVKGQLDIAAAVTAGAGDIVAALASLSAAEQVVSNLLITQAATAAAAAAASAVAQAAPTTPAAPVNDNAALTAPTFTTPGIDTAAITGAITSLQVSFDALRSEQAAQAKTALAPIKKTADILVRVSRDGESLQTAAA